MKITACVFLLFLLAGTVSADTELFMGAPVIPDGKVVLKNDVRLEKIVEKPYEEVLNWYKKVLEPEKDVKFRDRGDETAIEDHSNREWHSITVTKPGQRGGVEVVIIKDNWTWILGTLVLRFIGVFVVLLVLYVAMAITGAAISRALAEPKTAK